MVMYIVIAIMPNAGAVDATVAAYSEIKNECVYNFRGWICNGEEYNNMTENERAYVEKACRDLMHHGITDKQDSGCFYRMEVLR